MECVFVCSVSCLLLFVVAWWRTCLVDVHCCYCGCSEPFAGCRLRPTSSPVAIVPSMRPHIIGSPPAALVHRLTAGETPMTCAAYYGHTAVIRELIESGAGAPESNMYLCNKCMTCDS